MYRDDDKLCFSSEEEKEMLQQQAKMAAMGEMIGNIAHQWRQPLNALSALNVGLGMKYKRGRLNDEEMQKFKEKSNKIIQNMSNTIDDFKNFFKPDKVKKAFRLNSAINGSLRFVSDSYKQHNITIERSLQVDITLNSYKNELMQVLLNILNNSKDAFIENNISTPKVSITTKEDAYKLMISIQDNAGGVKEEILNKIYDPYFTTKFKSHGTGIGLYMSKMIIEESMGGSMLSKNKNDGLLTTIILNKETKDWSYNI